MGAIYQGVMETGIGERRVAVKVMHQHLSSEPRYRTMFFDEARVLSSIHHPNVVQVIDFGMREGVAFLVMEWMDAYELQRVCGRGHRRGNLPMWLPIRAVVEAARGLHAAHELRDGEGQPLRIVHRDVSPGNILLVRSGAVKIIDFGVAQVEGRMAEATRTGELKGKIAYMAPEQIRGNQVDRRVDVWALGVVLWEMLAGKRLFRAKGSSDANTMHQVLYGQIPPCTWRNEPLPEQVDTLLSEMVSRQREERPRSAMEVADRLENYLYSLGEPCGASQLAAWLTENVDGGSPHEAMLTPSLSEASAPEISAVNALRSGVSLSEKPPPLGISASAEPTTPKKRALVAALAAVVLVAVGVVVAMRVGAERSDARASAAAALASNEAQPRSNGQGDTQLVGASGEATASNGAVHVAFPSGSDENGTSEEAATAIDEVSDDEVEAPPGTEEEEQEEATPSTEEDSTATGAARMSRRARMVAGSAVRTGKLSVVAVPAATVSLRGRSLGQTPLFNIEVPAGRHRLTVKWADGSRRNVTIRIDPGGSARVGPVRKDEP